MTDSKAPADQNEIPEDVAALYSWANLHGVKYRDFSAARAQSREIARRHMREATVAEPLLAGQEGVRRVEGEQFASPAELAARAALEAEFAPARISEPDTRQPAWQPPSRPGILSAPLVSTALPTAPYSPPQPHNPRIQIDAAESARRPAWLSSSDEEPADKPASPALEDMQQGSSDRLTSRWFALQGAFNEANALNEAGRGPVALPAPVMAFFSLAGGVGKSSLVATLGRVLSARGERVMLVDTAAYGILPFFFGSRDQRPGVLRTFRAPGAGKDAPILMLAVDPDTLGPEPQSLESSHRDTLVGEIARHLQGVNRVLIDLATASRTDLSRIMSISPTVLVPVIPDMNSVVSVGAIDAHFQRNYGASGEGLPYYLLNQFDASISLHLDLREVLRERLGDRLLPFALRRAPAMSEALAEGMTVIDYAPNSTVAEDFGSLAGWVKSLTETAGAGYRGVRWSER